MNKLNIQSLLLSKYFMKLLEKIKISLFKNIYTIFTFKHSHHNKCFWPYFKVSRENYKIKEITYKKLVIPSSKISIPKKETLIIVATGPSIKQLPEGILENKNYDYLGVNGAISLRNTKFIYYVIFDQGFIINRFDLVKEILETDCILFTRAECLLNICKKIDITTIKCKIKILNRVNIENKIECFMDKNLAIHQNSPNYFLKEKFGFSLNIEECVFDYHTVAYVALQIAYSLNYKYIYIAGLDLTNLEKPRFYENESNKQATELKENIEEIKLAFNTASIILNKKKIKVFNLSKDSLIEDFPKITLTKDFLIDLEN